MVPDVVLEQLSSNLADSWEAVARRLDFENAEIQGFMYNCQTYPRIQLRMLQNWKQRLGSEATYQVLFHTLCDDLVNRRDLAEMFCVSNNHAAKSGACFICSAQVGYTLFFYKNVVFPGQAEYSYFSADFRL